jgi:CheY-like chemotaxis protein
MAPPPKHILLVEDDYDIGEALGELLRELGHEVRVAVNGKVALQALLDGHLCDVILLDLMMPVMDGYEFRARQLAHPNLSHIPCVVVSADTKAARRQDELRPVALLGKPVPIDELMAVIDSIPAQASPS